MTKSDKTEAPHEKMERVKALRDEAFTLEKQAVREAIILGDGYLARAATILGLSTAATLARMVNLPGARHADLKGLLHHITGRPPRNPESIEQRARQLPKALKAATEDLQHKPKAKPVKRLPKLPAKSTKSTKPKPAKKEDPIVARDWDALVSGWLIAREGGANQKEYATRHGVGVSTLRERTAAYLARDKAKATPEPDHYTEAQ